MKEIHNIQRQILGKLQFATKLRFSDMRPNNSIENNQFAFHLKQLVNMNFVEKLDDFYILTDKGKEFLVGYDTKQKKPEVIGLNVAWLICSKGEKTNRSLLVYTRKKHPFFGCQGFPAGKIKAGESVAEGAKRELLEETGLVGEPIIKAVMHFRTYSKINLSLVQDKFMYLCYFTNPTGDLNGTYEGDYEWVRSDNLFDVVKKPFSSIGDMQYVINLLDKNDKKIFFEERVDNIDYY